MPTKKASKKFHPLSIVVAVLAAAVLANAIFTFYLMRVNISDGNFKFNYLVVSALENLNSPLVIEPVSGKAYIPAARLNLPPSDENLGEVLYHYNSDIHNDMTAELNLVSKNNTSRAASALIATSGAVNGDPRKSIEKIPSLQACARGVSVVFRPHDNSPAVATKLLSNGKTVYFYTEPNCPNETLLNYAKQIDSY